MISLNDINTESNDSWCLNHIELSPNTASWSFVPLLALMVVRTFYYMVQSQLLSSASLDNSFLQKRLDELSICLAPNVRLFSEIWCQAFSS